MCKWFALILIPMPSIVKIWILRALGHQIHSSAYIGFSYINIKKLEMRENSYIGFGNIFTNLESLEMHEGSRINRWNRFTSNMMYHGKMRLLKHASIALRHYFDVCDLIEIGQNTICSSAFKT